MKLGWLLLIAATLIAAVAISPWVVLIPVFLFLLWSAVAQDFRERRR